MKRTADQIHADIVGTCQSDMTDEELDDVQLMQEVDELMFECQTCNWWCDTDEANEIAGEQVCNNCHSEDE